LVICDPKGIVIPSPGPKGSGEPLCSYVGEQRCCSQGYEGSLAGLWAAWTSVMTKRIDQPITVTADQRGWPQRFRWRRRQVAIGEIVDHWEEAGCWWLSEPPRRVYRARSTAGALYELHHRADGWRLYRAYD
jgi:hypothetical protein